MLEKRLLHAKKIGSISQTNQIFEEIFNTYSKLIGFIIYKYVDNKEDVEDLVVDVFMNFYQYCLKKDVNNIKALLVKIAKNKVVDFYKTRKLELIYDERIIENTAINNCSNDYYDLIKDILDIVTEEDANILILHSVYDYSFKEIGKEYQKPEGTIKTKYHRAIKEIRRKWKWM